MAGSNWQVERTFPTLQTLAVYAIPWYICTTINIYVYTKHAGAIWTRRRRKSSSHSAASYIYFCHAHTPIYVSHSWLVHLKIPQNVSLYVYADPALNGRDNVPQQIRPLHAAEFISLTITESLHLRRIHIEMPPPTTRTRLYSLPTNLLSLW